MKNNFKVKVDSKWDFDIPVDEVLNLDSVKLNDENYHLLMDHKSIEAEVITSNFNKRTYAVKVNGTVYDVAINSELDQLIKSMGFSTGSAKNIKLIKAPMPGLVLGVNVKVGQTVSEDEGLLILEAMKMESTIASPCDGVVKSISVKSGDAIEKGQLLIEFE